jgi:hypothetical protein
VDDPVVRVVVVGPFQAGFGLPERVDRIDGHSQVLEARTEAAQEAVCLAHADRGFTVTSTTGRPIMTARRTNVRRPSSRVSSVFDASIRFSG